MGNYRVIKHEKNENGFFHKYYTIEKLIYFPNNKFSLFGWEPLSVELKTEEEVNRYLDMIYNPIKNYTRSIIKQIKI